MSQSRIATLHDRTSSVASVGLTGQKKKSLTLCTPYVFGLWKNANPSGWFGEDLQRPALLTWLWWLMGLNWISGECEGGKFQ